MITKRLRGKDSTWIFYGCNRYSAIRQLKAEDGHEWPEGLLCVTRVIHRDVHNFGRADAGELSRTTNMSTAIVRMDRSILSVMKVVLNFTEASKLQHAVSFVEVRIRDTVDDILPSP